MPKSWYTAWRGKRHARAARRRGAAALDYILVLGVILPLAVFTMWAAPRMMNLVYQMTSVLVSWPFM
ncbi:MAG: hypothetical protein RIC55_32405 [Pirellulaceae bacterium]